MIALALLLAAPTAHAVVCDDPLFALLAAPPPEKDGVGVVTGAGTLDGKAVVGGRFSIASAHTPRVWRQVLLDAESQDEWVPKRFGYVVSDRIDADHMYMRFDLAFLMNSVHVQRQLVVRVTSGDVGDRFRTCWRMVDPGPHLATIGAKAAPDIDWERASTGWWEVTPQPDGTALVNYQWWAESGKVPAALQRWGASRTLPDLLRAFEARVASLSR
ncbi:MAG: hypothetical protein ACK4YP_15330 [Myxococcota bacterium]